MKILSCLNSLKVLCQSSALSAILCRLDEASEDRMSPVGSGLELGVILDAEIERVVREFHLLHEGIVRSRAAKRAPLSTKRAL